MQIYCDRSLHDKMFSSLILRRNLQDSTLQRLDFHIEASVDQWSINQPLQDQPSNCWISVNNAGRIDFKKYIQISVHS